MRPHTPSQRLLSDLLGEHGWFAGSTQRRESWNPNTKENVVVQKKVALNSRASRNGSESRDGQPRVQFQVTGPRVRAGFSQSTQLYYQGEDYSSRCSRDTQTMFAVFFPRRFLFCSFLPQGTQPTLSTTSGMMLTC